jgi:hypothetical protein
MQPSQRRRSSLVVASAGTSTQSSTTTAMEIVAMIPLDQTKAKPLETRSRTKLMTRTRATAGLHAVHVFVPPKTHQMDLISRDRWEQKELLHMMHHRSILICYRCFYWWTIRRWCECTVLQFSPTLSVAVVRKQKASRGHSPGR